LGLGLKLNPTNQPKPTPSPNQATSPTPSDTINKLQPKHKWQTDPSNSRILQSGHYNFNRHVFDDLAVALVPNTVKEIKSTVIQFFWALKSKQSWPKS
jgi:hypothetical protein